MSTTDDARLIQLMRGYWLARSVWVAAELGLADRIGDRPRTAQEIASHDGLDPVSVARLLAGLTLNGYFSAEPGNRFRNNAASTRLRGDIPGSIRLLVRTMLGTPQPEPWARPDHGPGLHQRGTRTIGDDSALYWLNRCPELVQQLTNATHSPDGEFPARPDFDDFDHVIDVGSGVGNFAMSLLRSRPHARATLLDLPDVAGVAKVHWVMHGMTDRVHIIGGDFFTAVPEGGDLYLLRFVLHEWPDDQCLAILTNIAQAAAPTARLLVVDTIRPEESTWPPEPGSLTGHERSRDELIALLSATGFEVTSIRHSQHGPTLIQASPLTEADNPDER